MLKKQTSSFQTHIVTVLLVAMLAFFLPSLFLVQANTNSAPPLCNDALHVHDETCFPANDAENDQSDNLSPSSSDEIDQSSDEDDAASEVHDTPQTEETEREENADASNYGSWSYEDSSILVNVSATTDVGIPQQAQLVVETIEQEEDTFEYDHLSQLVEEEMVSPGKSLSKTRFFRIFFLLDGKEIVPTYSLQVDINFKGFSAFCKEDILVSSDFLVLNIDQSEEITDITTETEVFNLSEGIRELRLQDAMQTFGIALLNTDLSGVFLQQVTNIDSTTADYILISGNGSFALTNRSGNASLSTKVNLMPIKGNPTFYQTNTPLTNDMLFRFDSTLAQSGMTSIYSKADSTLGRYINLDTENKVFGNKASLYLRYNSIAGWWRLHKTASYLSNALIKKNEGFTTKGSLSGGNYHQAYTNFTIYKLVSTTLSIPSDPPPVSGITNPSQEPGTKPSYPKYITPSALKSGIDAVTQGEMSFSSDKATSQLENLVSGNSADDGKVWTDKSVIYRGDDYGAFSSYQAGTFGVSLSALTQHYKTDSTISAVPMDVIFILDLSGSMTDIVNEEMRATTMITALNQSINHVMDLHSENKVGVVFFNDYTGDILELDRYYVSPSAATAPDYKQGYHYLSAENAEISAAANLRKATGGKQVVSFDPIQITSGTYTQLGLQAAYNMFARNQNTSYTLSSGVQVPRTPLIIMLSDGAPTHATDHYMNPAKGPHYGSGHGGSAPLNLVDGDDGINAKGVMGYYTVLSALYFKNLVGVHYDRPAMFASIGIGILNPEGSADNYESSVAVGVGDDYARAILKPSAENLHITNSNPKPKANGIFGPQFYQLLHNTYPNDSIRVRSSLDTYSDADATCPVGVTNAVIPVLPNPYSEFDYADFAYFEDAINSNQLRDMFNSVIDSSVETRVTFSQSLKENTTLKFEDTLGENMAVQSGFVLRYEGKNYSTSILKTGYDSIGSYTQYQSSANISVKNSTGDLVSLRGLVIRLYTLSDGAQKVIWEIPNSLLPAYRQAISGAYYFEMLPIRLLYQVGFKSGHQPAANTSYYTSAWTGASSATATFTPHSSNPFYAAGNSIDETVKKANNITNTLENSLSVGRTAGTIIARLGNNGMLRLASNAMHVSVTKSWYDADGVSLSNTSAMPAVTVQLYRRTSTTANVAHLPPVTLSYLSGWTHTFSDLPKQDAGGNAYIYSVVETSSGNYTVSYVGNGLSQNGIISIRNTLPPSNLSIGVQKTWYDQTGTHLTNLQDMPAVSVQLYRKVTGGIAAPYLSPITLSQANSWQHVWTDLPKQDSTGKDYIYSVEEISSGNYTAAYFGNNLSQSGTIEIRNTISPKAINLYVQKLWYDENGHYFSDASHLPPVSIQLYRKTESSAATAYLQPIVLNAENGWFYAWADLPQKDAMGQNFIYSVLEVTHGNFSPVYYNNEIAEDGMVIIENYLTAAEVSVEKKWLDLGGNETSGQNKNEIMVSLMRGTNEDGTAFELAPVANNPATLGQSNSWQYTWSNLATHDENGTKYYYFVSETVPEGYQATYRLNGGNQTVGRSEIVSPDGGHVIVYNKPDTKNTNLLVQKKWLDASGNPMADTSGLPRVTIELYLRMFQSNDYIFDPATSIEIFDDIVEIYTLDQSNQWQVYIDDFQRVAEKGGKVFHYFYYIKEQDVPDGFFVSYSKNNMIVPDGTNFGIHEGTLEVFNRLPTPELPETGAGGTGHFTIWGCALLLSSLLFGLPLIKKTRRGAIS